MIGRRLFLKIAGLAPFALLAGRAAAAPGHEQAVALLECNVAGFQYHDGMRRHVMSSLASGSELTLIREPDNSYDTNAIALHTRSGAMIGYLPRSLNHVPAALLDQRMLLRAAVSEVSSDAPPWERVRVKVWQVVVGSG